MNINDIIASGYEWYDNHTLETILACPRKAFYHKLYKGGLAANVGNGARFGSCVHAGLAAFYNSFHLPFEKRLVTSMRQGCKVWQTAFAEIDAIDPKHSQANLIRILDHYIDTYYEEDLRFIPIQMELLSAALIEPENSESFTPFWWITRADGVFRRRSDGSIWVFETKTISSGVKNEIKRLKINRQTRGYVYNLRQTNAEIAGVLANVVLVAKEKRETARDFIHIPKPVTDSWRKQTINIVESWRRMKAAAKDQPLANQLDIFVQSDRRCTDYGICAFFDACYFSLSALDHMEVNTWTPFLTHVSEAEQNKPIDI